MSRDQKFVIAALVLGNLILYVLAFYSMPAQMAQAPVSSPPTVVQIAAVAPTLAPDSGSASGAAETPSATSTPEQTTTPTEAPTIGMVPTETPAATETPTLQPTLPPGVALKYTPTPTVRPYIPGGTPLYPAPTRTPRPPTVTPTAAPAGGTDPSNALAPADGWRTIAGNTSLWYKIGTGGNHLVANLQAQPLEGMRLEVFAPNIWDKPIGAGSRSNGMDGLVWAGGRWENYGDWFARVINNNAGPVTYRLMVNSNEIPGCEVIGYWEWIGSNYVYWKKCK